MESFFEGILKDFWGFGSPWDFDELFVGFSWALGQGWVVLGSGSEDLFRRETKIRFSSHFGPPKSKNRKLMRKIELVQGWPRSGAQIRKSQNTEDIPGEKKFETTIENCPKSIITNYI
jgi:hypothetical protein